MSDLTSHTKTTVLTTTGEKIGYSLLHRSVSLLSNLFFFLPEESTFVAPDGKVYNKKIVKQHSLAMILVLLISFNLVIIILRYYFKNKYPDVSNFKVDLLTLSVVFVSMIINPFSNDWYLGIGTPNTWHNPTIAFSKPFSILVYIYIINLYEKFKNNQQYFKDLILIALFSFISMWAKPSFLLSFLPAVSFVFIFLFIKKEISFKQLSLTALALSFSLIPLAIIANNVYGNESASGQVIFQIHGFWSDYSNNIIVSLFFGLCFPICFFAIKKYKISFPLQLALINLLIAIFIKYLFVETGPRANHGNLGWTYSIAMFIVFFTVIEEFFFKKNIKEQFYKFGIFCFSLHLISGLIYFLKILLGYSYR